MLNQYPPSPRTNTWQREDLVNLYHLLQAAARHIRRSPDELFDGAANQETADHLVVLANQVNERLEVQP